MGHDSTSPASCAMMSSSEAEYFRVGGLSRDADSPLAPPSSPRRGPRLLSETLSPPAPNTPEMSCTPDAPSAPPPAPLFETDDELLLVRGRRFLKLFPFRRRLPPSRAACEGPSASERTKDSECDAAESEGEGGVLEAAASASRLSLRRLRASSCARCCRVSSSSMSRAVMTASVS